MLRTNAKFEVCKGKRVDLISRSSVIENVNVENQTVAQVFAHCSVHYRASINDTYPAVNVRMKLIKTVFRKELSNLFTSLHSSTDIFSSEENPSEDISSVFCTQMKYIA